MSRLPDLERALLDAATRVDARATAGAGAAQDRRHARRWRRRSAPLLAGIASRLIAGGALAAVTGLLNTGDPVPKAHRSTLAPVRATQGFVLAGVRASDPDGGPPWAIGIYDAIAPGASSRTPSVPGDIAAQLGGQ